MDATMARCHGYSLAEALFLAGFQGVFPVFRGDRNERPYLTRFGYHGIRFSARWWMRTARRPKRRETMRTNGKRPGPPTRPHETVAVSPSPAFIKALASSGLCE